MEPADRLLLTRALVESPEQPVDTPPVDDTFLWYKQPCTVSAQIQGYVDGLRLDAEHDLHGLCARQGWAIAAYDSNDELLAAAHGLTPWWAEGIHATGLWGLLKAVQTFDPSCPLLVDCKAVQIGAERDAVWATAPMCTLVTDGGGGTVAVERSVLPEWWR